MLSKPNPDHTVRSKMLLQCQDSPHIPLLTETLVPLGDIPLEKKTHTHPTVYL